MFFSNLIQHFQTIFGTTVKPRTFFAPGRINLIGEHIDYNGGHVLPASISYGTYALAQKRNDQKVCLYSLNFPHTGIIECELSNLSYNHLHDWANYPKGMLKYIRDSGLDIPTGMNILFSGTIPNGAGLSSSASIEMVTGVLLEGLYNIPFNRLEMIQIGQKVENEYIGVNSGIMDQFAIAKGKKDHAILLNCQTFEYQFAPIYLENHTILIINTNKQRILMNSSYNTRRSQCDQALLDLQSSLPIKSLGELSITQFEQYKYLINDETNIKRAKHVVYENARTKEAFMLLQQRELEEFGKLMNKSHLSLQQDFEVTGMELDIIVSTAWEQPGIVGARMTGAGFGGCAIALIENDKAASFKENVNRIYTNAVGYQATFYQATIGDGARELKEGVL